MIAGCVVYFGLAHRLLDCLATRWPYARHVRPWAFLLPALVMMVLYLIYPALETLRLSITDQGAFGGGISPIHYQTLASDLKFWEALYNNILWVLIVPACATALGLLAAKVTDQHRWGPLAQGVIFIPMAISAVAAAVIWKLVFDARPIGSPQVGLLNALYVWFGGDAPQTWLTMPFWNNLCLMAAMIWVQTGFAMVVLAAALRAVPHDTIEAAQLDGAGPFALFFYIQLPQIMPAVIVVWTIIMVAVLKVFDLVFAMTNGQWGTQVLANYIYDKFFRAFDWGAGSAAAIVLMGLVAPVVFWNMRRMIRGRG